MTSTECSLCGLPVIGRPIRETRRDFCCEGCRRVWVTASEAGLGELLESPATRRARASDSATRKAAAAAAIGARRDTLRIDGMWCSSCGTVLEDTLMAIDGVLDVEVSYSASLARVTWDPSLTSLERAIERVRLLGYEASLAREAYAPRHDTEALFLCFVIAASCSMWVMWPALFMLYPEYWAGRFGTMSGVELLGAILSLAAMVLGGWPFLRGAWGAARVGRATMDTLVVLGTWSAWFYSAWAMVAGSGPTYFESSAMITTIVLLGRWIEALSQHGGVEALRDAAGADSPEAWLVPEDSEAGARVPVEDLRVGDTVIVRAGERVPVDGVVLDGESEVDRSRITGEPLPAATGPDDEVWAGSVNLSAMMLVRATRVGADTLRGRLTAIVEDALFAKSAVQRLADAAARVFVPSVIALAAATLVIGWASGAGAGEAVSRAVAVLVVSCPCALGLATPLAISNAISAASARGLLIRGGTVLERAGSIGAVAFDKTGTLTEGRPVFAAFVPEDAPRERVLRVLAAAAGLEAGDPHPVANAIAAAAQERSTSPLRVSGVRRHAGQGLSAKLEGPADAGADVVAVGSERLMREIGAKVSDDDALAADACRAQGELVVWALVDGETAGLRFADPVRPGAADAISWLSRRGVGVAIVSGDAAATCRSVAERIGADTVHAEVLPQEKEAVVRALSEGGPVAFVGDGVNDAAALAAADLAIAMDGGSDLAIGAADVVLLSAIDADGVPSRQGSPLAALPALITLARRSRRVIDQNLAWAFGYNVITLPLAATGHLSPIWAAAAMASSSLAVVANSLRLRSVPGDRSH